LNIGIRRDLGESEKNKKINKFYFKQEPMYVYRASFMKHSQVNQIRDLTKNNSDAEKRFLVPGPMTASLNQKSAERYIDFDDLTTGEQS